MSGRFRWIILWWLFIITLIAYLDRVNFSVSVPIIMKQFGINAGQMGLIMSAFTLGYTIMNLPGGVLADRFSPRSLLIIIMVLWSAMTIFTGLAWSFMSFFVIRLLFGIAEGPLAPTNTKIVSHWMLPLERATASGLWIGAMTMGVVIGAPLSSVIVTAWGWRSVFFIFGVVGLLIGLITYYLVRTKPEEHPAVSKEELALIQTKIQEHTRKQLAAVHKEQSFGKMLADPWVWVISLIYFGIALFYWANLNWLPTYFVSARGSTILKSGIFSALPYLSATIGIVVIGLLSDRISKGWRVPWLVGCILITIPAVVFAINSPSLSASIFWFCVACFFNMAAIGLMWAIPMELYHSGNVAMVSGFMHCPVTGT